MTDDPRVEAAARAITARYGEPDRRWKQDIDDATVALEAADKYDRDHNIFRISKEELERIVNIARLSAFPNPYGLK